MKEYKLVLMYNDDETLDKLEQNEYLKFNDDEFYHFLLKLLDLLY